ncbi:MAG: STAS domain-containing protein [Planctomycetota bacterium]|nr:STAS domain-containing protein [Planctomycetota bacterium]
MKIDEERQNGVVILRPQGPIAGADVEQFRVHLARAMGDDDRRIVVDLGRVQFVDSQALEALLDVNDKAIRAGASLSVCRADETLREVFALTGLDGAFRQYESLEAALAEVA